MGRLKGKGEGDMARNGLTSRLRLAAEASALIPGSGHLRAVAIHQRRDSRCLLPFILRLGHKFFVSNADKIKFAILDNFCILTL